MFDVAMIRCTLDVQAISGAGSSQTIADLLREGDFAPNSERVA